MAKMRVHELAKELDIKSADIVKALGEKGIDVKAASSIDDDNIEFVKTKFKNSQKESSGEATEDEKKEKSKPRVIITSKGVIRRGERHSKGDGEKRRRRHSDGEHHHSSDKKEKSAEAKVTTEKKAEPKVEAKVEPKAPVKAEPEVKKEQPKEAVKAEPVKKEEVKPVAKTEPEKTETPKVEAPKVEPKKEEVKPKDMQKDTKVEKKTEQNNNRQNKPFNRDNNDRRNDGQRNDRRNDRGDNKGGYNRDNRNNRNNNGNFRDRNNNGQGRNDGQRNDRRNDGQRNDRRNDRNDNRGYNRDRNNNGNNGNYRDRNNNGNFRDRNNNGQGRNDDRRNDFRRNDNSRGGMAPAEPIQNKDRKSRENKLRQDRQERNKKNYDDNRQGKNGRKKDFSKPVMEKPKKKEEKKEEIKVIEVPDFITIGQLAERMKMQPSAVIKKLFLEGKMVTVNTEIDFDSAEEIALGYDIMCEKEEKVDIIEELLKEDEEDESLMVKRPPVVCVMGHVDHGKTSLLDTIRKTNVIEGEAGGITQHIGAYKVNVNGREITFLDTPGHEAFTSMRARGAQITDIAILVVAADDGVMPQTVEAINHAKAAEIPIIVAVNKIDLPNANIEKIKQDLMQYDLVSEEWGGDTIFVPISAKKGLNINNLLEMVLLVADMKELKANPNKQSKGAVIEARLDKSKGPIASVLVQRGTLNVGDTIVVGTSIGRIRAMKNDKGQSVKAAGPSTPVEIMGLTDLPEAGDTFYEVKNEKMAKHLIEKRKLKEREKHLNNNNVVTLNNLFEKMASEDLKQLNLIVKADVQGSAEAIKQSLEKLSNDEVKVKVIHSVAGAVNESDVQLAKAAEAIIIAFNVRPVGSAKEVAEKEGVEIKQYSVIYKALEDVEAAMKGLLDPIYEEKVIGNALVRQTFKVSGVGTIAGCFVTDGKIERNAGVRVIRDSVVIHEGKLVSLKRFKDDVKEVTKGFECGCQIENYNDLKENDVIEFFVMEEVKR